MQALRTFGTVLTFVGFGTAALGILTFIVSIQSSEDIDTGLIGFAVAGVGFLAFMGGMHLSDFGKTSADFKQERKAGKTTCYACGTKRRLEQSCPKCGAPPSSSI